MARMAWWVTCFSAMMLVAEPAYTQNAVPVVIVSPTITESAPPLRLSGTLTSERFAALSPYVDGLVVSADVDEGHAAKRGETLVRLDATLAKLQLAEARARLNEAQAKLAEAERLWVEAEKLSQNISQSTLRSRESQKWIEESVVARVRAELLFQEELIERHVVRAPFDGVVVKKLTEVGEWAEVGRPVLEFLSTDRLRLDVQVPQAYYPLISRESSALVRIDAFPDDLFTGQVLALVPSSDPNRRTFLTRLVIDHTSNEIIAGMSAEVSFSVSNGASAVEIPRDALVRYPDGSTSVWVVEETDNELRAHERQIVLGDTFGETVKVIEGLSHTSSIVVRGNETLDEGATVRLVDRLPGRGGVVGDSN